MKILVLPIVVVGAILAGCHRGENLPCNPATLMVKFTCGEDLAPTERLAFRVRRDDGVEVDFETALSCPGGKTFEIEIPDYEPRRTFKITATPLGGSGPVAPANVLDAVSLQQTCTFSEFVLSAVGGSPAQDAGLPQDNFDSGDIPRVDGGNVMCSPNSVCAGASCVGSSYSPERICDATGQCPVATPLPCPDHLSCDGNGCRASCKVDTDCAAGRVCATGDCVPPVCGNGVMEPGEQCDHGQANGDQKLCSAMCELCMNRPSHKACGDGVCIPTAAPNCCADADCPSQSTSGKCDNATHTCWIRETVTLTADAAATGRFYSTSSSGCLMTDFIGTSLRNNDRYDGLVTFTNRLPQGGVVEQARLSAYQYDSDAISYENEKVHAASCTSFSCVPNARDNCEATSTAPILCYNAALDWCFADVTKAVQQGRFVFTIAFPSQIHPQWPSVLFYASGEKAPMLKVTVLRH